MNVGIVPLIASIISLVFAITVLDQYFARRKSFQLIWAIGLFMYAVSAFTEFWFETNGISSLDYRLYYFFGGICVAAYLGMGTVYLLARRVIGHIVMAILVVLTIIAAVIVFTADLDLAKVTTLTVSGVMPTGIRLLTGLLNIYGTIALVGGAIWSAWVFWRKKIFSHRVVSNILIAVGALLPAIGGAVLAVKSSNALTYTLELVGIIIIFIGFLRTREVFGFFRFPLVHGFKKVTEPRPETPPKKG